MVYLPMDKWRIVEFKKSTRGHKKYMVELTNGRKTYKMHFGDRRYGQYEDRTPLKEYSDLDHKDPIRRRNYINRQGGFIKDQMYSPGWFSMAYLW